MRFVIQRVKEARVCVEGKIIGQIGKGFLLLLGISNTDTQEIADKMVNKLIHLRIFEDENDKTNLSIKDVGGELLVISQFTLYADCKKGNRPSFVDSAKPEMAEELYKYFVEQCQKEVKNVETGIFGAHMEVELLNSGPVTIILEK